MSWIGGAHAITIRAYSAVMTPFAVPFRACHGCVGVAPADAGEAGAGEDR